MAYTDYAGEQAPRFIRDKLFNLGGRTLNPSGNPIYRMVKAANVLEKKGQRWQDWDPSIPVADRGVPRLWDERGNPIGSNLKPTRVVCEVREIPKYPQFDDKGWVLERWMPPSYYGSESAWYRLSSCVPGTGIPMLGPYPTAGKYEFVGGPFMDMPTITYLEQHIGWLENHADEMARRVGLSIEQQVKEEVAKQEKADQAVVDENAYRIHESMSLANVVSLGAGRWRNKAAEHHGIRSHMGN